MKKAIAFALMCLVFLGLVACDPIDYSYVYIKPEADIVGVELISYDNPNARQINTFIPIILPRIRAFKFDKMSIVEALDSEKLEAFSKELDKISVWTIWTHLNSPAGTNVRILYDDGCFDVLSPFNDFAGRYDSNGKAVEHWGHILNKDDLIDLVNTYFTNHI